MNLISDRLPDAKKRLDIPGPPHCGRLKVNLESSDIRQDRIFGASLPETQVTMPARGLSSDVLMTGRWKYSASINLNIYRFESKTKDVDCGSYLKVIRKFFIKHNKSFRWHLGDYEKHIFFPFEGL